MKLTGQQHEILTEAILGTYREEKLTIFLLTEMEFPYEQRNKGGDYEARVFNLIIDLQAEGTLEDFIKLIIEDKPRSPFLDKVKSEFKIGIEEDNFEHRGRYALVVGINNYNSPSLGKLETPAEGAEAIAKLLETHGKFQVLRQNLTVTQRQLKQALLELFKPEGKNIPETALFYFFGYGLRETRGIDQNYLASSDANPDEDRWGISLEWLRKLVESSPVKQQIIWLDCCGEMLIASFAECVDRE